MIKELEKGPCPKSWHSPASSTCEKGEHVLDQLQATNRVLS